ncbi:hypothetical protein ACFWC5_36955 [Streptomyces sp. NPDC060085]|uniref:hypothetical protein n=1 Tax=Streptomyces sp. NPDC060085 TaxID=3347054 RepID=UPI00365FAC4F
MGQLVDLPPARETKDLVQASKAASDAAERLLAVDAEKDGPLAAIDRFLQDVMGERPELDE